MDYRISCVRYHARGSLKTEYIFCYGLMYGGQGIRLDMNKLLLSKMFDNKYIVASFLGV